MTAVDNKAWYAVRVLSGTENKVKSAISVAAGLKGLDNLFDDILVVNKVIKTSKNKETTVNLYPGYIFVNADLNSEARHVVSSTRGVVGFVGNRRNPPPMSQAEVARLLKDVGIPDSSKPAAPTSLFSEGDYVRVIGTGLEGHVKRLSSSGEKLVVTTNLFDRPVDTEVSPDQIQKIS